MIDVYVASAFSKDNKGGNKAGVVFILSNLSSSQKMRIAKELGYSETAFVSDSSVADFKLQYFTPTEEVPLCGHATIATFSILKELNMQKKNNYTIETKAGILKIKMEEDGLIFMEQSRPAYLDVLKPHIFVDCLGDGFIDRSLPIQIVSTGLKDIMLPIDSREHLEGLRPDFKIMEGLSKEKGIVGVHAFTLDEKHDVTAICRNFAPLYGIDEESATGTSNCALACYLFKYFEKKAQYVFEQGFNLGLVSRIVVNITYHDSEIDAVYVGGYGYLVGKKAVSLVGDETKWFY